MIDKNSLANSKLFRHFGLKLVALTLAFMTWLIVMNVSDNVITKNIFGIVVTQENGDVILQMGKVYDVVDGEKVDIVVKGPRSVVESLSANDFTASADLSKLSITNTADITVTANDSSVAQSITILTKDKSLTLSIEDVATKEIPINVITTGEVAANHALGSWTTKPNLITVKGPQSVLERVTEARAVVELENAKESFEKTVAITCFDINGQSLDNKNIELSEQEITVNVTIYPTKTVDVVVNTRGTPAEGYELVNVGYTPQTMVIYGTAEELEEIDKIEISDISVSGAEESIEKNVLVNNYIPDDVYISDVNSQIFISIKIEQQMEKELTCNKGDITIRNRNPKLEYNLIVPLGFTVTVCGLEENLNDILVGSLAPYVDYLGYGVGEYEITLQFANPKKFNIKGDYTLRLIVVDPDEESTEDD